MLIIVSLLIEYPNIRAFAVGPGLVATDMLIESFRPLAIDTRMYLVYIACNKY